MILASIVAKLLRIDIGTTEGTGVYMNVVEADVGGQMGYTRESCRHSVIR